jgi:Holliday junction resolvase-like predicted endonuclease
MTANIIEIKSGDTVLLNNSTYDHLPLDTIKKIIETASSFKEDEKNVKWLYGDYDVIIIRKID